MKNKICNCKLIELPKIENRLGNITPVENRTEIPFNIKRIFYLYDIPGGKDRGAHAHKDCHQFLIAAAGSFEVHLDDGDQQKIELLNQPYKGLHIPPGVWASECNFSSGAICLVLASHTFDESDYIRDYEEFIQQKKYLK